MLQFRFIRESKRHHFGQRRVKFIGPRAVKIYGVDEIHDDRGINGFIHNGWDFFLSIFRNPRVYGVSSSGEGKIQRLDLGIVVRGIGSKERLEKRDAFFRPDGVGDRKSDLRVGIGEQFDEAGTFNIEFFDINIGNFHRICHSEFCRFRSAVIRHG